MAETAHFDSSDTDKIYTTYSGAGSHSGTPSNGSAVQVWQDEQTPSTRDLALIYPVSTTTSPLWRNPGNLILPSLDWESGDVLELFNNAGSADRNLFDLVANNAKSIFLTIRVEGTATNVTNIWQNTAVLCDSLGYFGIHLKTIAGITYLIVYNFDTGVDVSGSFPLTLDTTYVIEIRHDGSLIYVHLYTANTPGSPAAVNTFVTGTTGGNGQVQAGRDYLGVISELVTHNTDLGDESTPLTDMLDKWFLSSNTYDEVMSGSLSLEGSFNVQTTYNEEGSGGAQLAATSDQDLETFHSGSGGTTLLGSAPISVEYHASMSGGLSLSGVSSLGSLDVGSGGVSVSGTSDLYVVYSVLGSGDLVVGGDADADTSVVELGDGAVSLEGSAIPTMEFNPVAEGGVVLSGASPISAVYDPAPAGSIVLGGEGVLEDVDLFGSGGLTVEGAASVFVSYNVESSGGADLSGVGSVYVEYILTISGGVDLSGSSEEEMTFEIDGVGGILLEGTAIVAVMGSYRVALVVPFEHPNVLVSGVFVTH